MVRLYCCLMIMQSFDELTPEEESGSARVQDIRRQWAIHEDEALAHKLQDEEINIHYSGNRTRNAIVRDDYPKAREEQRREEQEALEKRLQHLSLLQRQAEEDARIAQKLAQKYESHSHHVLNSETIEDSIKEDMSLLGASCCLPSTSATVSVGRNHHQKNGTSNSLEEMENSFVDEEDLKQIQEQQDAELAKKVQQEFELYEKDKMLAIEAQDRELAKMLYEKEKARLKRAKERARLKAEAAALNKSQHDDPNSTSSDTASELTHTPMTRRTPERNTCSPPTIPEKYDGFLGFKANPKKLPKTPQQQSSSSSSSRRRNDSDDEELIPPYMPIHGFNRAKNISPAKRPHH